MSLNLLSWSRSYHWKKEKEKTSLVKSKQQHKKIKINP
jgi:hypothetical protein